MAKRSKKNPMDESRRHELRKGDMRQDRKERHMAPMRKMKMASKRGR